MSTLIALDPGHGVTTPGKRSPASLGQPVLREYLFNRQVVTAVEELLDACGITHLRTAPTDADTSSTARLRAAAGCKLFVSIHANAGGGTGIETFHSPGIAQSERLARLVQQEVITETGMHDRAIKTKNLWVTRETPKRNLTACLIELGFMDTASDLQKLREDTYRRRCAVGIVRGICLYLGVAFHP